jgi:AsmA family protein
VAAARRGLKIIGWILGVLVALVVIAAGALWVGGGPVAAWAIQHPVSGYIGRGIRIGGPVTVDWGAPTRIVAEDVHLANAPWGSQKEMFAAKRLEIRIFLRSALSGPTRIPLISLEGAKLLLEKSKQGQKNWDLALSSTAPKKRSRFPEVQRVDIRNSELIYRNGVTGAVSDLGIKSLAVGEPNPTSPVEFQAQGSFQKAPLQLAGKVGPLGELRETAKPYPVYVEGALGQAKLTIDGTIKKPLEFDGLDLRFSMAGAKLHELASMLGVPLPEFPDFRGTAKLTGGDAEFALQAISLKTGKSDLEGGIDIDANPKVPQLKAQFTSSYIDLADFKGLFGGTPERSSASEKKPKEENGRVLPDTRIALNKLPGVNADLSFSGKRIKSTGGVPFEAIALGVQLQNGELTVKPLRFRLAQGDVDLNFHFTPFTSNTPPKMQAEVDVRRVDLHQLLGKPSMPQMLRETRGIVGGFVKIDTTGASMREFLAHMNGDSGFFMENGQISELLERLAPIDVLSALGVYLGGDKPVPINCLVSRFAIKQGVATATTLLFDTHDDSIVGNGNVNFGGETIYLDLTPYNKHFTAISLRTPVQVRGTFAKPAFHLETGKLIARLGEALGLAVTVPPAALIPLVDTGLGDKNACSTAYAMQRQPGNPEPKSGGTIPHKH